MDKKNLKEVTMKVENGKLSIEIDIKDIIDNPENVTKYERSSTGNSYTIAVIGNNFSGERLQGLPLSVKLALYAGKKDIQDIQNLIATRRAAEEAAARQRELEELRSLKKLLDGIDINELKKALANKK